MMVTEWQESTGNGKKGRREAGRKRDNPYIEVSNKVCTKSFKHSL